MPVVRKTFQYGSYTVSMETGKIARQADSAVLVNIEDTVVLASVTSKREPSGYRDFLPLSVHYQERAYAAGKIPGGFFKREGRPSEKETLVSRLIDRPIRPLFPEGFSDEVQIIATVLSLNPQVDADIPALLAASAAISISGIPFNGPIGAARIGFQDGNYLLNPTLDQLDASDLDLVVAGTDKAVLMVESQAKELSEQQMLEAVTFGHEQMQSAIEAIKEMADEVGNSKWEWQPSVNLDELNEKLEGHLGSELRKAYTIPDKIERQSTVATLRDKALEPIDRGKRGR